MGIEVDNDSELREAQATLFNPDGGAGCWIALNYSDPETLHFAGGGENFDDLANNLQDDEIGYAIVRIQNGNVTKDVFIQWIGPNVGNIEKNKKLKNLDSAQSFLQPFHSSIDITTKDDLNNDKILELSNA